MNHKKSLLALCFLMLVFFPGCSSSPSAPAPANVNGVFADALVSGMPFSCGTQNGMTGPGGTFSCAGGSTVTFTIGGIIICTAPAQEMMTPVSCAQSKDPTANVSTAAVIAVARLLLSISTTPPSSGTLTITAAELQNAANLSLDFSNATDAQLLLAVGTINPGASLVSASTAENELLSVIGAALAGNFGGTFSGVGMGTWMITVGADGSVTGSGMDSKGNNFTISGTLVSGTKYSGTAGSATWTGNMDTSQTPIVFSGTYTDPSGTGTFTGTKH